MAKDRDVNGGLGPWGRSEFPRVLGGGGGGFLVEDWSKQNCAGAETTPQLRLVNAVRQRAAEQAARCLMLRENDTQTGRSC